MLKKHNTLQGVSCAMYIQTVCPLLSVSFPLHSDAASFSSLPVYSRKSGGNQGYEFLTAISVA